MATKKSKSSKAAPAGVGKPPNTWVSSKIAIGAVDPGFRRADLIFEGVDHAGASYEARVFLNNERASAETEKTAENGYAGSFHIFGHGGCYGDDITHCDVGGPRRLYDPRPGHPLTPARKILIATAAVKAARQKGDTMTVTVVPVVYDASPKEDYSKVLKFDSISVSSYA